MFEQKTIWGFVDFIKGFKLALGSLGSAFLSFCLLSLLLGDHIQYWGPLCCLKTEMMSNVFKPQVSHATRTEGNKL